MKSDKCSNEDAMEKEKIEVVFRGKNSTRDIDSYVCCSGAMFALRA